MACCTSGESRLPSLTERMPKRVGSLNWLQKFLMKFSKMCVHRLELAVLPDFRHRLQEQLHLVEDEDDVAHLGVLGDRRFRGFFPCIFLCHN